MTSWWCVFQVAKLPTIVQQQLAVPSIQQIVSSPQQVSVEPGIVLKAELLAP